MGIKKNALKVSIGFLILTAIFSIWIVLVGEFGDFEIRVLLTTVSISIASMCAMACGAHIEKTHIKLAGGIGIVSAILSLLLTLLLVWAEMRGSGFWRLSLSSILVTFSIAHVLLLNLPPLIEKRFWLRYLAGISVVIMSLLILTLIWDEEMISAVYFRLMSVMAIIIALISLLIPIFSKLDFSRLDRKTANKPLKLTLTQVEGSIYLDQEGQYYKMTEIDKSHLDT